MSNFWGAVHSKSFLFMGVHFEQNSLPIDLGGIIINQFCAFLNS